MGPTRREQKSTNPTDRGLVKIGQAFFCMFVGKNVPPEYLDNIGEVERIAFFLLLAPSSSGGRENMRETPATHKATGSSGWAGGKRNRRVPVPVGCFNFQRPHTHTHTPQPVPTWEFFMLQFLMFFFVSVLLNTIRTLLFLLRAHTHTDKHVHRDTLN